MVLKKTEKIGIVSPPHQQLSSLLEYYQSGRYDDAEKLAESLTEKFPKHQFSWKLLGALYGKSGRYSEAINAIQLAVALSPEDAEAHFNLGIILKNIGKLEEAEASYRQAIAFKSDYLNAHFNLGYTLQTLGRLEEAEVSYRQAIMLKPDYAEVHSSLGSTLQALGRLKEAEESYKRAININPRHFISYNNLGSIYERLTKFNDAIVSYKKSIELNPDYLIAHANLGSALKASGRLEEAEKIYIKSITLNPKNPNLYLSLGMVLRELGKVEEAIQNYKQTIILDPKNKTAQYKLGIILFECGQYKEAAEYFKLTDIAHSRSFALKCSYLTDDQSTFLKKLDNIIDRGQVNAVIGSLSCRSEIRFGIKRNNPFCNKPLKHILNTDLKEKYDFKYIFTDTAKDILRDDTLSSKSTNLVNNGYQTTGNIFDRKGENINKIKSIIHSEIEGYRYYFNNSDEGVITRFPSNYSLHGWFISMRNGGNLSSHMHDNGWLSGSIYINVPPKLNIDSGNLVVCIDDGQFGTKDNKNLKESIDVVTGNLCLFPSSLLHHTVPFESKEEERIVLAFDVIPK